MQDTRVFHLDADWIQKYNAQGTSYVLCVSPASSTFIVQMECASANAWDKGGAKLVQEEAPRRLETLGWDPVRRALAITVR
jgi:hypothetical protein